MERRLQQAFFGLSLLALVLILAAEWQASTPSWKNYQGKYLQLEAQEEPNAASKSAVLATPLAINQVILPGLQRVDRCTTCHLGVEDPTMKNAPEPFRYHAALGPHVPSKFGCTICHGGQGLATDMKAAHGKVAFWQNPLLPADYVRASCGRCHKEGDVPGVPELTEGRHLFETEGCRGCHKLNGVGGSIGPDLTAEGANQRSPGWLVRHFLAPNVVSPGSAMPNFHFTREQARALTYYMLSLTSQDMGSYYSSMQLIPSPQFGRRLFEEKDCMACHAIGGVGGKTAPDLAGVTKRHSTEWLDEQLVNPELVYPGSSMPEYDLESNARKALVAFLATATPEDAQLILARKGHPLTPQDAAVEAGKQDFARFGCAGCHGTELQGGVPNPNAQGGQVPSLLHVSDDYTKEEVIGIIRNGRVPPLDNPKGQAPPLYMPSWKSVLSDEDINRIADFLWSKQQKKESW
ncbi:MAG TPA: c-type cytochrome [Acidobacteriaceae bacterium]|nr:c-type cytochrome [Acidobacteriaceae bacterium]